MTWFNKWGTINLFGPGEEQDNDNPLLFSAYYSTLGGDFTPIRFSNYLKEPGLLIRSPDRPDASNSWDEDLGACWLSGIAALNIYEYGKKHWWYYNTNTKVNKFSWSLVRQPSQQYVVCKAAYKSAGLLRAVWFTLATAICGFNDKQARSSELLTQWLSNKIVIERCNPITRLVIDWFNKRFDWVEIFKIYFPAGHPIIAQAERALRY